MTISLILPFRERWALFENMVQTLIKNTSDIKQVEVIVTMDNCDPTLDRVGPFIDKYNEVLFKFLFRPRSDYHVRDYVNPMAHEACGRWIIVINDDVEFLTPGWDQIVINKMAARADLVGDDILLGLTKDQINRSEEDPVYPNFSCWNVVSKEMVNALGYLYDPRCVIWGPDHVIAVLFRKLAGNSRIVSLVKVTIGHLSIHTGRRHISENYKRFCEVDKRHGVTIADFDMNEEADKLRRYISGIRKQ